MSISIFESGNRIQDYPTQFHLVEDVELFTGMNNVPMLYLAKQDKYIRLSPLGAKVITLLTAHQTTSSDDLVNVLAELYPSRKEEISQKALSFLSQLAHMGVIDSSEPHNQQPSNIGWWQQLLLLLLSIIQFFQKRSMLRIKVWHPNKPVAESFFNKVREIGLDKSGTLLLYAWLLIALVTSGYITIIDGMLFNPDLIAWPFIIGIYLLHMILHELSHVFVSSYYKVKIRSVGIGLLYYVLPFFYMDRTDSYRLQATKHHAYIALAGPAFDISAATVSALIATLTTGWLKASFHVLLITQIVTFIADINPLLPTDGYRALEAFSKSINFRQRAFQLVFYTLIRKKMPGYLSAQPFKVRFAYFSYGVLSAAWMTFLVSYISIWYFTTGVSLINSWLFHR